jgi:hypothetical protein
MSKFCWLTELALKFDRLYEVVLAAVAVVESPMLLLCDSVVDSGVAGDGEREFKVEVVALASDLAGDTEVVELIGLLLAVDGVMGVCVLDKALLLFVRLVVWLVVGLGGEMAVAVLVPVIALLLSTLELGDAEGMEESSGL